MLPDLHTSTLASVDCRRGWIEVGFAMRLTKAVVKETARQECGHCRWKNWSILSVVKCHGNQIKRQERGKIGTRCGSDHHLSALNGKISLTDRWYLFSGGNFSIKNWIIKAKREWTYVGGRDKNAAASNTPNTVQLNKRIFSSVWIRQKVTIWCPLFMVYSHILQCLRPAPESV